MHTTVTDREREKGEREGGRGGGEREGQSHDPRAGDAGVLQGIGDSREEEAEEEEKREREEGRRRRRRRRRGGREGPEGGGGERQSQNFFPNFSPTMKTRSSIYFLRESASVKEIALI